MRRRDIIMASPYAVELAVRDVLAPVYEALDADVTDMSGVRRLAALADEIHDVLDVHTPDGPDKLWRASRRRELKSYQSAHQWKCRALDLNPATTPTLALGSMTPINSDGWKLGIAVPAPDPMTPDMTEIVTLVMLDPKTGKAVIFQDKTPQLVEPISMQRFTVHADAKAWARDIARHRLEFVRSSQIARRQANIPPIWHGLPPSALAVGKLDKIDWPFSEQITAGEGVDPKALAKIFRKPSTRVHAAYDFRSAA